LSHVQQHGDAGGWVVLVRIEMVLGIDQRRIRFI